MTDRELLELAAKAAKLRLIGFVEKMIVQPDHRVGGFIIRNERGGDSSWNPLKDDGDALRLAVKLFLRIDIHPSEVWITNQQGYTAISVDVADIISATRRAIVRAAAEIGKAMP